MKQLALALALTGSCVFATTIATTPASALETYEAQMEASDAASQARIDMLDAFGPKVLKPGQYVWRDVPDDAGPERVVISLSDQMAYLYRGSTLVAASTISSGRDDKPTPSGIFSVLNKTPMHHSNKYDNAPMPFAQFFESHGIAMHAGYNPGYPASHGCIRIADGDAQVVWKFATIGTRVAIR
jgi:lipoprotein-anchoring transpeptidase ErfK/SrfK